MTQRLQALAAAGQAVWLDFLDRGFLRNGGLQVLIEEDGLSGVTSNPTIFEKAMSSGHAYDESFKALASRDDLSTIDIYEHLAIEDICNAADILRPVYERLAGRDGYVSLEVSPFLALETEATVAEARRLWAAVDRPNLMVKVPGTEAGAPAIRQLIEDGININVTLLFSLSAYQSVADAYLSGLEARLERGDPVDRIASVASFFVSRIDVAIDNKIDDLIAKEGTNGTALENLRGKLAIANAKSAYAWYRELIASARWQRLAQQGAMPQRLLWASTGTKNPDYSDVLYVDSLMGPDTVNTMPQKTMDAFRDHGTVHETLLTNLDAARRALAEAERAGLDFDAVTRDLSVEAIESFTKSFEALLKGLDDKKKAMAKSEG